MPFVFHATAPTDFAFSAEEYRLSTQMIDLWGSFARTGVPAAPGLTWPLYPAVVADAGAGGPGDASARPHVVLPDPYLAIDVASATGDGVRTTSCDFWDSQP